MMKRTKRVTLKDIAKELDMCFTSVSRILRGDTRFNAQTVRLVQDKAKELNYRPNLMARALASQGTSFVGLILNDVALSFNAMIIQGVQDVLEPKGYSIMLSTTHHDEKVERRHIRTMIDKLLDGIIITPASNGNANINAYKELVALKVPFVTMGIMKEDLEAPNVHVDHVNGGRMVAKHLIDIGHKYFCYISPCMKELSPENQSGENDAPFIPSENKERYDGFMEILTKKRMAHRCTVLDAHMGEGVGEELVRQLLAIKPRPTAIFCYSDLYAMQLIRQLEKTGLRVPKDFSVVGYDDMPMASLVGPALTTIQQPKEELGRAAATKIKEMIDGTKPTNSILQPQLVVRESTAPPSEN